MTALAAPKRHRGRVQGRHYGHRAALLALHVHQGYAPGPELVGAWSTYVLGVQRLVGAYAIEQDPAGREAARYVVRCELHGSPVLAQSLRECDARARTVDTWCARCRTT